MYTFFVSLITRYYFLSYSDTEIPELISSICVQIISAIDEMSIIVKNTAPFERGILFGVQEIWTPLFLESLYIFLPH